MNCRLPPISPFGLIQETLWPNEWKILVACMMLNCTTRKQVDKILPRFFSLWPDPKSFLSARKEDVSSLCRPLGFANRRTDNLLKMTRMYLESEWKHASELHGVGQYGSRSWEIFCQGILGDDPPVDHALVQYWKYCKLHGYMSALKVDDSLNDQAQDFSRKEAKAAG